MNDQSIRRFALKYYRQSGAVVRSLDERGDAFEVRPREGNTLTVNFDTDNQEPHHALTATSPQWRNILDDLTGDVTVSYRYLTAGPIAHHLQTLSALMPAEWTLIDARLTRVESRQALGYSHRVTFDSPALNARREMMQHHLWDVRRAKRFLALESVFYQTPYIVLKPEQQIAEPVVQHFLTRSLELVDQATDTRGQEIEETLQTLALEAEQRITDYFAQQRQTLTTRLEALEAKFESLSRAVEQTGHPQHRARMLEEQKQLSAHLEGLRAQTAEKMTGIEQALTQKLEQERARHELTAVTDLAAICHVAYDRLWYNATVQASDGTHHQWELSYCPVARELTLPPCSRCAEPLHHPLKLTGGRFACAACVSGCRTCGCASAPDAAATPSCHTCKHETCAACSTSCGQCHQAVCQDHVQRCGGCQQPVCATCQAACQTCGVALCSAHARFERATGLLYCPAHQPQPTKPAQGVTDWEPMGISATLNQTVLAAAAPLQPAPQAAKTDDAVCENVVAQEVAVPTLVQFTPAAACSSCNAIVAAENRTPCATCGLHTCSACAGKQSAPCLACDSLMPASARDGRLGFVFERFPHLMKHKRQWDIGQMGDVVLCQWSYAGRWGQVVYHVTNGEPVLLSSFECGWFETLLQQIVGFWRD